MKVIKGANKAGRDLSDESRIGMVANGSHEINDLHRSHNLMVKNSYNVQTAIQRSHVRNLLAAQLFENNFLIFLWLVIYPLKFWNLFLFASPIKLTQHVIINFQFISSFIL